MLLLRPAITMATKKPSFEDYEINEKSPAVRLTMEALNISREEAVKLMKEMNYRVDYPKEKKKKESR